MIADVCEDLGMKPAMMAASPTIMRLVGLFSPGARETVEMMYEFTRPFVVDPSRIEQAFGLIATPMTVGIPRTAAWFKDTRTGHAFLRRSR